MRKSHVMKPHEIYAKKSVGGFGVTCFLSRLFAAYAAACEARFALRLSAQLE